VWFFFLRPRVQRKQKVTLDCPSSLPFLPSVVSPPYRRQQAWFARDVILGKVALPDRATMDAEWAKWRQVDDTKPATDEAAIRFQADYVSRLLVKRGGREKGGQPGKLGNSAFSCVCVCVCVCLAHSAVEKEGALKISPITLLFTYPAQAVTDYPSFDIEGVVQCFLEWEHNKHEDIMTFRDKPHKSVATQESVWRRARTCTFFFHSSVFLLSFLRGSLACFRSIHGPLCIVVTCAGACFSHQVAHDGDHGPRAPHALAEGKKGHHTTCSLFRKIHGRFRQIFP